MPTKAANKGCSHGGGGLSSPGRLQLLLLVHCMGQKECLHALQQG